MRDNALAPIRVLLVDDHALLREGTQAILERADGIAVVGAIGEGAAVLQLVAARRPDVVLLDLHLPDIGGVEVARALRAAYPALAIIILTGQGDAHYARALLRLGIRGYLSKTVGGDEIVAAIRAVAQGRAVLATAAQLSLQGSVEPLTAREHEVLRWLVRGRRNAEIGKGLNISVSTIEYHVRNIIKKLGAQSRAEAIHLAYQHGLAHPGMGDDPGA